MWPDGDPSTSLLDHCYQVVFFLVTYVLPMLGLSVTYCHLGTVLWTRERPDTSSGPLDTNTGQSKKNKTKDKRKVSFFALSFLKTTLLSLFFTYL